MTGPNILTLGRIVAIPILVITLLTEFHGHRMVSFIIFVLAVLTDMLDGFWARLQNKKSSLGELLDPTADKLIITSALICLVELDQVPAWMAIIIIGREIAVTGFRAMASSRGISIPASILGKIKMNAEAITIALLILGESFLHEFYLLAQIGLWVILATALSSAAEYYWRLHRSLFSRRILLAFRSPSAVGEKKLENLATKLLPNTLFTLSLVVFLLR